MTRLGAVLGGAVVVLALSFGCARKTLPPRPPPVPLSPSEIEAMLEALERQAESVHRYQGLVRVRGRGPEGGFDARLVVVFERPDRMRVELLGAFGATRWSAVADETQILAYFPGRKQYVLESDVESVVALLLGVELDTRDLMAILSGVGVVFDPATVVSGEREGASVILRFDGGRALVLDDLGQVVEARAPGYRARYESRWKNAGRNFPDAVVLENDTLRARILTEEVDVNVPLAENVFVLELAEGATRLRPAEVDGEAVFVVTREPPP
ncbi:MAG TPA: hypothetical protein VEK15_32790 [Vicinamibacteria bacterium]|nr:hypothetical protein [Vicinamibacteria bacterium]